MHLFAYGSLMHPPVLLRVAGLARVESQAATLHDYRRGRISGESFPGILAERGECVPGILYRDMPAAAWGRLDRFEGELYVRTKVSVALEDGDPVPGESAVPAETYVLEPAFASILLPEPWRLEDFLPEWQAWLEARMEE